MQQEFTITEAASLLQCSIDTVKRRIHRGELHGRQEQRPQGFRWLVELDPTEQPQAAPTNRATNDAHTTTTEGDNVAGVQAALLQQIELMSNQLEAKDTQIAAKDGQITELHVLLQQSQAALPAPAQPRRWWQLRR